MLPTLHPQRSPGPCGVTGRGPSGAEGHEPGKGSVLRPPGTHQGVERGDGQDAQPAQGQLGGAAGGSQQALGVGQLPALQAGQVAAHPEQIHVEPLQVLLPLLNLGGQEQSDLKNSEECPQVKQKM